MSFPKIGLQKLQSQAGPKPSSVFYKLRRGKFVSTLQEHFQEEEGSELSQQAVLEILGLDESQKIQATNAMKEAFAKCLVSRKATGKQRVTVYKNVTRKHSFTLSLEEPSLAIEENSEIANIKQLIASVSSELDSVVQRLDHQLTAAEIQRDVVRALVDMQRKLQLRVQELSSTLERLYENEVQRLLLHQSHCEALCANEKAQLNEEIGTFIGFLNIGLETQDLSDIDVNGIFSALPTNTRERCPLLFDVLDTLLLHKADGRDVSEMRVRSAVHSLAILVSLRSQKIQNDLKVMFTCLCISFGAGMRFITMLNHLGLTVSWDKAMHFFDSRKAKKQEEISKLTPTDIPVILMFDNINMYRGKHKHLRLFKYIGPTMWNFTGQAVLIPSVEGLEDILQDKNASLRPQKSVLQLDPNDIFIQSDQGKADVFGQAVDAFLLESLDDALNKIPPGSKKIKDMTESELNSYISNANFNTQPIYKIKVPKESDLVTIRGPVIKSNVHVLSLSLEDNSTIVGTMSILDQLASDFSLPNEKKGPEYLPFDSVSGTFDVHSARSHFELLISQYNHQSNMCDLERQLRSREREIDGVTDEELEIVEDGQEEGCQESTESSSSSTTLDSERRRFEAEDKHFWEVFNLMSSKLSDIISVNSEESYLTFVNNPEHKQKVTVKDHLGRSLLHVAVEQGHESFAKCLVDMGLEVNYREGCGITPLSLAVLHKNNVLCKFLVESGARYSGPLFTSIPSPRCMAERLQHTEILQIFAEDQEDSEDENELIRKIDGTFSKGCSNTSNTVDTSSDINRSCSGFVTPVVGDVGTCKTNNAAMSRSGSYRWVGLCPGDLHNKGYFCEAAFKVHGSSGLHYILLEVMKRKKLTTEVFKNKKFQENNLIQVREAVRDVCKAYGIAAAVEFSESDSFPTQQELRGVSDASGLLLDRFKDWVSESSGADTAFQHRATAFLVYGPIQKLYDASTAYGDGYAREVVYQTQLPIYAQLGFRNYYTEVFRHIVNFLAKWPLATRILLQQNCSVNLSGKKGQAIELDGFVESEVVQPLKKYASGHTTVTMCERLMANIDMLKMLRGAYVGKEGFDVHHTSRHCEQTSFPDQLKGAWFCLQKGFFRNANRQEVECYPVEKKGSAEGKVPKNLISVVEKGQAKIKENFKAKLYESFPDLRYEILSL